MRAATLIPLVLLASTASQPAATEPSPRTFQPAPGTAQAQQSSPVPPEQPEPPTAREPGVSPSDSPELTAVLRRAGEYVTEYERSFSDLVTEETYIQHVKPTLHRFGRKRTTRADLVFVRLAGEVPWASYRDVFEVDGRVVRDREDRLAELFMNPRSDAHEQARRLLAASAAYNIGPVVRTVNLPTLPLLFLLPRNQGRFAFWLGARRTIAATEAVEVVFRETSRPTLVRGPYDGDLPTTGRFWVSATHGTVVRSEVEFDFGPKTEAGVTADYRPEPALAMWVPTEMKELFAEVRSGKVPTFPQPFEGVARYGKFRRFSVSTQESVRVPPPR